MRRKRAERRAVKRAPVEGEILSVEDKFSRRAAESRRQGKGGGKGSGYFAVVEEIV
jgi:hypothetical protein